MYWEYNTEMQSFVYFCILWNAPETKILALKLGKGTQIQDDQEGL